MRILQRAQMKARIVRLKTPRWWSILADDQIFRVNIGCDQVAQQSALRSEIWDSRWPFFYMKGRRAKLTLKKVPGRGQNMSVRQIIYPFVKRATRVAKLLHKTNPRNIPSYLKTTIVKALAFSVVARFWYHFLLNWCCCLSNMHQRLHVYPIRK